MKERKESVDQSCEKHFENFHNSEAMAENDGKGKLPSETILMYICKSTDKS